MADDKKKKDEVTMVNPPAEDKKVQDAPDAPQNENTEKENAEKENSKGKEGSDVVVADNKPVVVKEKYVTVKPKISGRKFIGSWVTLEKDKEIQVTADQKRCLLDAGAIYL